MKKTVCLVLSFVFAVCAFASCRPNSITLTDSQMDEIITMSSGTEDKARPSAESILGVYRVEGKDEGSDHTVWNAYVTEKNGKILLQLLLPEEGWIEIVEPVFSRVTSKYDPETGKFEQTYVAEDRASSYEAYFSVQDDNVKIDLQNTFFYYSDGVVHSGVKAMGYKSPTAEAAGGNSSGR